MRIRVGAALGHSCGWSVFLPHFRLRMHEHVRAAAVPRLAPGALAIIKQRVRRARPRARGRRGWYTHSRVHTCVRACVQRHRIFNTWPTSSARHHDDDDDGGGGAVALVFLL